MKKFFLELDAKIMRGLQDNPRWPLEKDLPSVLRNLNGERRFATLVSALPEELDMRTAENKDFNTTEFLQVGGAADRLLLQIGRREGREQMLYNISFEPTAAGARETERLDHGPGHSMVRPQGLMTWEQAVPIFCHYVRNDQTLPSGLWLRDFNDPEAASFQE